MNRRDMRLADEKKSTAKTTAIAVVLPQFHPIAENDTWWGKGFTEWRNVAKAQPQFKGHYQPHLPGELGFYDLRLPETREAQAALAAEHGISGFCYYHYWFNGHRLLHRPIDEIAASGQPDFPFCLCWANENWSRAWDGGDREVLLQQNYTAQDDEAHIRFLLRFFRDRRYIRLDGKPLFIVYKADQLPQPQRTFDLWRRIAQAEGVGELMLAQFQWGGDGSGADPRVLGLDLSIEFSPDWRRLGGQYHVTTKARFAMALGLLSKGYARHSVHDYDLMVQRALSKPTPAYPFLRCVTPGFDNTARRPNGATIVVNSSPSKYGEWLQKTVAWTAENNPANRQVVFINAWNEWAEGNHLEPDLLHGRAYLEATRDALAAQVNSGQRLPSP
jgi:lipopolysaccharide biosynthesis protein